MKSRSGLGKSLLDKHVGSVGGNLSNANTHHARNLPILLTHGQSDHTLLSNLFITMLNNMGIEMESFGQIKKGIVSFGRFYKKEMPFSNGRWK